MPWPRPCALLHHGLPRQVRLTGGQCRTFSEINWIYDFQRRLISRPIKNMYKVSNGSVRAARWGWFMARHRQHGWAPQMSSQLRPVIKHRNDWIEAILFGSRKWSRHGIRRVCRCPACGPLPVSSLEGPDTRRTDTSASHRAVTRLMTASSSSADGGVIDRRSPMCSVLHDAQTHMRECSGDLLPKRKDRGVGTAGGPGESSITTPFE